MTNKKNELKETQAAAMERPPVHDSEGLLAEQPSGNEDSFQYEEDVQEAGSVDDAQEAAMDMVTTVVIPFFKVRNVKDEVLLTVRSCRKYLREDIRIMIIGDSVDALADMEEWIEYKDASGNQSDLLEVLKLAVISGKVSDKFVLIEPGTYLIDDIRLSHIELDKHMGLLNPGRYTGEDAVLMENTQNLLRNKLHVAAYDYNTHCPVVLEKEKLTDLLEEFPEILSGRFHVLTVYCCACAVHPVRLDYRTDNWMLPVVSEKPDPKVVERLISGKCFLYLRYFQNVGFLNPFIDID